VFEDLLKTFTDRREVLALFEHLRHREPHQRAWPFLPILTFIAPGGSGKSTLIEYLISGRCCKDGRAILPYAHIDFTHEIQLRDLLSILIALRDRLQSHADEQKHYLTFPRFDLGAAIANESPLGSHLPVLGHDEVRRSLQVARSAFKSINEMGNALGNAYPYIPPLLIALQWVGQTAKKIPGLNELLLQLAHDSAWQWYCMNSPGIGVSAHASISEVFMRLHALSISSRPSVEGREYLVNHVLPAAFVADLLDGLDGSECPRTWNAGANIVLFFDGFEALLESSYTTAIHLLEILALHEERKHGKTDPLVLVVGTRTRLLENIQVGQQQEQYPSLALQTYTQDEVSAREYALECYTQWHQQLPRQMRYLRLSHLYLPLWLYDFGRDDTRYYLSQIDRQKQTQAFADGSLVNAIHFATHGHPLYLALAAAVVLEAQANGTPIDPAEFDKVPIPVDLELEQLEGQQDMSIGEFLLSLFLRQLSEKEQDEFIFCAVPRALDRAILRALLQLPSDVEAEKKLNRYRQLTFVTAGLTDEKMILHPIVRSLLLRKLPPGDYQSLHSLLRTYFHQKVHAPVPSPQARVMNRQAQVEEAYHKLALGDPQPVINLGIYAQQKNLPLWEQLIEIVTQIPWSLMVSDMPSKAALFALQGNSYKSLQEAVTIILMLAWSLSEANKQGADLAAQMMVFIGNAYRVLPGGDGQRNLESAIKHYEAALEVFTREVYPEEWANAQNNLGVAYRHLLDGEKQKNLERAIKCFEAALEVFTSEEFPEDWAGAQLNLGTAYWDLSSGNRQQNVEQAIKCFEAALEVSKKGDLLVLRARIQTNLGAIYSMLPEGDMPTNLEQSIKYYKAALEVYTKEAYPLDWADIQNNLGVIYRRLPGRGNLKKSIICYKAALEVHTKEAYPIGWAEIQSSLGVIYSELPGSNKQKGLAQSIEHHKLALEVYSREKFPLEWALEMFNLGSRYSRLFTGDRHKNLKLACEYYKAALEVYDKEDFPEVWAAIQHELGLNYGELSTLVNEGGQEILEQSTKYFEASLEVYNRATFQKEHMAVRDELAEVLKMLENLKMDA
jgi:tetratricopeptide (TPR) repeat protein